jgi:hypothetical protein
MGIPFVGFPPLCPQLPVCQTLSPQLPAIFVPQLAGIGAWLPELFELFGLINGVSRLFGCAEIETGSATTSVGATYTWILGSAIVGVRNRHLPGWQSQLRRGLSVRRAQSPRA